MKARMMDPLPTGESASWTLIEWAISGTALLFSGILAWAGRVHFTVNRHDDEIKQLRNRTEGLATKDDIADIKASLNRLLDWALGNTHSPKP